MTPLKRWRTTQPVEPVGPNQEHPLYCCLLELTQVTPAGIRSSVSKLHSAQVGATNVAHHAKSGLIGRQSSAVSSTQAEQVLLQLPVLPFYSGSTAKGITLWARCAISGNGADGTSSANERCIYGLAHNTLVGPAIGHGAGSTIHAASSIVASRTCAGITVTADTIYDVFLSHPGGNAAWTLEVLGVGSTASSNVNITADQAASAPFVQTGYNTSAGTPGDKRFYGGGLFRKVLTADERNLIARNPWALWESQVVWKRSAAGSAHATTGALAPQAATVAGTATHKTLHTTTGALAAQSAVIAGTAAHQHATTGALASQSAVVAGTAAHLTLHTTSGALVSQAAAVTGTAVHLTLHATTGALAAQSASLSGVAVHSGVGATVPQTGAGKSRKRKRRYQVEIDGEVFDAASVEEAEEILSKAKDEAQATAKLAVNRASKAKARAPRNVLKDARKALELPEISVPDIPNVAEEVMKDIGAIYQDALRSIEISLLLRKAEQDEEDDEELLLLL